MERVRTVYDSRSVHEQCIVSISSLRLRLYSAFLHREQWHRLNHVQRSRAPHHQRTSKPYVLGQCSILRRRYKLTPPRYCRPLRTAHGQQIYLPVKLAFYVCFFSHTLAAAFAPIQDCDEVFNYWEPLHYLNHGYGLQTWEYSPDFSLRSWSYIVIHAIPAKLGAFLARSKTFEFYLLRVFLAFFCAASETTLFSAISGTLNPRIAILYLMIVAFSPGMFHASVALLPSSFAMYTSTLGLAAFIDWRGGPKTASGIMWFGIGALIGWPFSAILVAPFLIEELVICGTTGQSYDTFRRFLDGIVRSLIAMVRRDIPGLKWLLTSSGASEQR